MRSRASIADYAARKLRDSSADRNALVLKLAAWLKDTNTSRQIPYLVQDIAKKLTQQGYVYIIVVSARSLTEKSLQDITNYLQKYYGTSATFEINQLIDPSVIGGVRIDTPDGSLDATVKRKLIQIIKGA